ncbi:hypothetical protein DMN91_011811 [Ooceraea biroi]|uniref:MADF domain-containing protein n=1 Tax=Ooceraea biroi TaxID=2015173 RepID=A0A3L8D7I2_OOCBI|nr:hypothetical protein DMN91_011811 [Ooceraea biroi]
MSFQWNDNLLRKLITIVKCNTHLYDKNNKLFKDIKAKSLTWETIAKNVSSQCTGVEASRKFKNVRDIFAKEHKKIKSCAGRSGDGRDDTGQYTSSWEFYHKLLFLVEYITKKSAEKSIDHCPKDTSKNQFD